MSDKQADGTINMTMIYEAVGRLVLESEIRLMRANRERDLAQNRLAESVSILSKVVGDGATHTVTIPDEALGGPKDDAGTGNPG